MIRRCLSYLTGDLSACRGRWIAVATAARRTGGGPRVTPATEAAGRRAGAAVTDYTF